MGQGMIYAMMSSYISDYYLNVLHIESISVLLLNVMQAVCLLLIKILLFHLKEFYNEFPCTTGINVGNMHNQRGPVLRFCSPKCIVFCLSGLLLIDSRRKKLRETDYRSWAGFSFSEHVLKKENPRGDVVVLVFTT